MEPNYFLFFYLYLYNEENTSNAFPALFFGRACFTQKIHWVPGAYLSPKLGSVLVRFLQAYCVEINISIQQVRRVPIWVPSWVPCWFASGEGGLCKFCGAFLFL